VANGADHPRVAPFHKSVDSAASRGGTVTFACKARKIACFAPVSGMLVASEQAPFVQK
jgi:hypothetical protein